MSVLVIACIAAVACVVVDVRRRTLLAERRDLREADEVVAWLQALGEPALTPWQRDMLAMYLALETPVRIESGPARSWAPVVPYEVGSRFLLDGCEQRITGTATRP